MKKIVFIITCFALFVPISKSSDFETGTTDITIVLQPQASPVALSSDKKTKDTDLFTLVCAGDSTDLISLEDYLERNPYISDVNGTIRQGDDRSYGNLTLLRIAIQCKNKSAVSKLLDIGADPTVAVVGADIAMDHITEASFQKYYSPEIFTMLVGFLIDRKINYPSNKLIPALYNLAFDYEYCKQNNMSLTEDILSNIDSLFEVKHDGSDFLTEDNLLIGFCIFFDSDITNEYGNFEEKYPNLYEYCNKPNQR
jgi:hypothetical protein